VAAVPSFLRRRRRRRQQQQQQTTDHLLVETAYMEAVPRDSSKATILRTVVPEVLSCKLRRKITSGLAEVIASWSLSQQRK
jgi:hypothetical protein